MRTKSSEAIIITGAANGIGRSLALHLAGEQTTLGLIDVDLIGLKIVAEECKRAGSSVVLANIDVINTEQMEVFINTFYSENGCIDYLIANAGISPKLSNDHSPRMARSLMETNYIGMINSIHPAVSLMTNQRSGTIVIVTSISKLVSTFNSGSYSASKAAAAAYLNSLRIRLRNSQIKVVEITCGFVDTKMNEGSAHAHFVMIDANVAARKIARAMRNAQSHRSIPFLQNLPWYSLSILPRIMRDFIIEMARRRIFNSASARKRTH